MGNACKSAGPGPVQNAWENHFSAFGAQDVDKILLDYTEKSEINVYDQNTGTRTEYKGLAGVRTCFEGLFKSLSDCSDLGAPVQVVKEAKKHEPGSVFLIWSCPASGYAQCTDTFIFDKAARILKQNVVVVYKDPKGDGSLVAKNDTVAPSGSGKVHDGWANHFEAFGGQDVEKILKDYVPESEITVYNHANGTTSTFNGLDGARACFEGLFKSLHDCSSLAAPIIHVQEAADGNAGQVFLVWSCPSSGYQRATDTFLFNAEGKITRQNVVVHHEPVKASWDNHFAAFGGQDVEKILKDYTEQSIIKVYDQTTGTHTEYKGLAGVRTCFEGLFKTLFDLSNLAAPVITVREATEGEPGSVFLIWSCPASGYAQATDTFIFDSQGKILWQNVVVVYQDPKGDGSVVAKNDKVAPDGSGPVHSGWANHFEAFGGQDVEKILKDYVEESEITVYNHHDGSSNIYKGLEGAKTCFEGLFKSLSDTSNLDAPIIHVTESAAGSPGQVFLVWNCPASGYQRATDTFMFNGAGKITRQHVVVHYAPAA